MVKIIRQFYLIIPIYCALATCCAIATENIVDEQQSGNHNLYIDTTVTSSGGFLDGTVFIHNSLQITNNGTITSTLNVCNNCDLKIQNKNGATFNTHVDLGTSATVTQVIQDASDITTLTGIGVGYNVLLQDTPCVLNWENISNTTTGANGFILQNAKIRINTISSIKDAEISGNLVIYTNTTPESGTLLFTNVSEGGVVEIIPDDLNTLYSVKPYKIGSSVFMQTIRSTDYARILNNDTGRFLNLLREKSPNDKLLKKLDSAKTLGELNRVMSKSMKVHPIKLMQPLRTLYSHKMLESMHIGSDDSIGISAFTIFSDDLFLMGASPNANIKILNDLHMKVFADVINLKYGDVINEYSAMSYGAGTDIIYNTPLNNFIRAYGGFHLSSFNTGLVKDGNGATKNPYGYSGFVAGEFGHRFDLDDEYYMAPFVMAGGDYITILRSDDSDVYAGAGCDAGFSTEFDGMRYDYVVRGIVRTDGGFGAELNFYVWSVEDSIGGNVALNTFYDENTGLSYGALMNIRFSF